MAFNTTPYHGKVSRIEKNDVAVGSSLSWSLDVSLDMSESTAQGANWGAALPGIARATGQMEFMFVAGNTEQKAFMDNIITASPGTLLTDVKFLLDGSTNAFTGDLYITGFGVSTSVGDVVKCTFPIQMNDAVSLTDAA